MHSTKGRSSAVSKKPKPLKVFSEGEELLAVHLNCYKIPFQREVCLIEGRKWRVDFYLRDKDIAVEVEGGTWSNGRHSRGAGFVADCKKYNALALAGVKVLRFTTQMVISGEAIDTIRAAVG